MKKTHYKSLVTLAILAASALLFRRKGINAK